MKKYLVILPVLSLTAIALLLGDRSSVSWGGHQIPFDEANVFFELNNTDGDLGIHALIDGEAWKVLEIEAPNGRELLEIEIRSKLKRQGLTELFFESAEPTFDELAPRKFFRRFPEGEDEIEGETLEGEELESTAVVTHLIRVQFFLR